MLKCVVQIGSCYSHDEAKQFADEIDGKDGRHRPLFNLLQCRGP